MQTDVRTYRMTCSVEQAALIADACELRTRILMGQIERVGDELIEHALDPMSTDTGPDARYGLTGGIASVPFDERLRRLRDALRGLRYIAVGREDGAVDSLSSATLPESARTAFDIAEAVRRGLGQTLPAGGPYGALEPPSVSMGGEGVEIRWSGEQAHVAAHACEILARMHIGQLSEIYWLLLQRTDARGRIVALREFDALLARDLAPLIHGFFNRSGASYGIGDERVADRARVAFDLYQVIRHRIAWDRDPEPTGVRGVSYDPPMITSEHESLARIVAE